MIYVYQILLLVADHVVRLSLSVVFFYIGYQVVDTFRKLVKPDTPVSAYCTELTSIAQSAIDKEGEPFDIVFDKCLKHCL